jgi:hypothetical protein
MPHFTHISFRINGRHTGALPDYARNGRLVSVNGSRPKLSLLDLFLGAKERGDRARCEIQQRQRADALRYREIALALDRHDPNAAETRRLCDKVGDLEHELAQLEAELPGRISQQIADELPDAHRYLHDRTEALRNGT